MPMNARDAALDALERCTRSGAWSASVLDNTIKKAELDSRDAALASRLFLGVLQNCDYCDFCLSRYYDKPMDRLEGKVRNILRLGAYQLLFLDKIPPRAAVSESVDQCKRSGCARAAGLVNAILRRMAERKEAFPEVPGMGTAEYLSIRYSHPLWFVRRLMEVHGYAFTQSFLEKNNEVFPLSIQVNRLKVSTAEYCRALSRKDIPFRTVEGVDGCLLLAGGKVTELPGFEEGLFYVQDLAARVIAEAAGLKPGMRVLDACSAPGGKSFAAAIAMENQGSVLSCDIHEKKLSLIESGARRLGIDIIQTRARDAREEDAALLDAFDAVIADVPCSGLGVIGKKPEIRSKSEEEIRALPAIQREILHRVSTFVKPGGVLIYSTCTILPEENEAVVREFLGSHSHYAAEDFQVGPIQSHEGMYTFWPHVDGTDGFFAARLRRINE